MKLKAYTPENSANSYSGKSTVNVNLGSGVFTFNKRASAAMKLKEGMLIWVRETWQIRDSRKPNEYDYKASDYMTCAPWKPSIHMPKKAARIWLQVQSITVERLQDITEEDAKAEGVLRFFTDLFQEWRYKDYFQPHSDWRSAYNSFSSLWMSINGPESWDANPWVWVIRFKVVSTTGRDAVKL